MLIAGNKISLKQTSRKIVWDLLLRSFMFVAAKWRDSGGHILWIYFINQILVNMDITEGLVFKR